MICIKKNIIWNTIGTTLNAFSSFFLLIIITRINGVNDAGIYTFGFSIACLLYYIAAYSGRVYHVTDNTKSSDKDFILNKLITCFIMIIVTVLFILIRSYNNYKSVIIFMLCLIKCIEALSETFYAIFQKNEKLYKCGFSMGLKSLLYIIVFLVIDLITKNIIFSLIFVIVEHILIIIIYDIPNLLKLVILNEQKINIKNVKRILINGFFPFAISFLSLYVVNSPKYAIDNFLSENIQAIYGILVMPATITSLLSQFIIHPYLTTINQSVLNDDYKRIIEIIKKFIKILFMIGIVVLIVSYFFGIPILNIVYSVNLDKYRICFIIIMIGSIFNGISFILSNILIAMKKNIFQFIVYIVISIFACIMSNALVKTNLLYGACLVYLILMLSLSIIFMISILLMSRKKNTDMLEIKEIHTFVVLAYKESKYLEACIKSVLNQRYKSKVVIATSTPNDYISKLAKKYNLDIIINNGRKGIGVDFDFAISCAKTDLVTVAHQDDIYDYDYSYEIVSEYIKNKNSLILFPHYYEIKNNKKIYKNKNLNIKRILLLPLKLKKVSNFKFNKRLVLRFGNAIGCPSVTFNKNKVNLPIFDYNFKCDIDWHAWETLSKKKGSFVYIDKQLMGHRVHDESTTTELIKDRTRTKEDLEMFKRFWPVLIAKLINKFYIKSEQNNNVK